MNNPSLKYKLLTLLSTAVIALLMTACSGETVYPRLLVDADSAYVNGDYALGDSLLDAYRQQKNQEGEAVGMYRRLVETEQAFVHGDISSARFPVIDSLCRYYNSASGNYPKALLFMGDIYRENEAYPKALDCFIKAEEHVNSQVNNTVLGWIYQRRGDLYFSQRMFQECKGYYRKFYDISSKNNDTLRMAHASNRMGHVCMIENKADSAIVYYRQSISLARNLPQQHDIVPYSQRNICDIYIQTEEFDSAKVLMSHDDADDANWAYWHYGQGHTDSAVYYFKKTLGRYKWQGEVEVLTILEQIERDRGNIVSALDYSEQLANAIDSLYMLSQINEMRKLSNQHEYELIRLSNENIENEKKRNTFALIVGFMAILLLIFYKWKAYKHKMSFDLEKHRRMLIEEKDRNSKSLQQIVQNNKLIAQYKHQLEEVRKQGDNDSERRIELDSEILAAENKMIAVRQQRSAHLEDIFKRSPLYKRIKINAGNPNYRLDDNETHLLANSIDKTYDNFTMRLLDTAKIRNIEMKVCYLLKLGVQPSDIALMVGRSKSGITMLCQRLYKLLTGKKGTTKDLQNLLKDF